MREIFKTIGLKFSLDPISLVDIGARWGRQRPWNQVPQNYLTYYGFEADKQECERLNSNKGFDKSVFYFPYAISDQESSETLFITREKGNSSFYKPNQAFSRGFYFADNWAIEKEVKLQTTTLKKIFNDNDIRPDFLKIDTQGNELKILKGASSYLESVLGMEIEVEFSSLYENQPLFGEVDAFIRSKGFELFDLNRYWANRNNMNRYSARRGQVIFADAIYFRCVDSLNRVSFPSILEKKQAILRIILIFSLYGFFDAAVEYLTGFSALFSKEETDFLKEIIFEAGAFPKWQVFLLNNSIADSVGKLLHFIGNTFCLKSKIYGWGTDWNSVDGRYRFHATGRISKYFRK